MSKCKICNEHASFCEETCENESCKQKYEQYEKEVDKLLEQQTKDLNVIKKKYYNEEYYKEYVE